MRVDTTVVETNIHYPTDSSLVGDGVRVLTRTMKEIEEAVGKVGTKVRDRMRSIKHRLIEIGRAARARKEGTKQAAKQAYGKLMVSTGKVIAQAATFVEEVEKGIKRASDPIIQVGVEQWSEDLKKYNELTRRVLEQTKARVLEGNTHYEGKLVSIFETQTEVIRKGKSGKPTEFGKMVKIQEAEHQIISDYEVYEQRPLDEQALMASIEKHRELFERAPEMVAADAAFFSAENERKAKEAGVKKVAIPNRRTRDPARRQEQKQRWFRRGQRWRVGCEGRISVLKRRHGLIRSRYKGMSGMKRWVGWGVIGDNLIHIGKWLAVKSPNRTASPLKAD